MNKIFYIVHIITIIGIVFLAINGFSINWIYGLIPILLYFSITWRNTALLVIIGYVNSKLKDNPIGIDKKTEDLFFGREIFVIAILNFVVAISFSSVINLIAAAYFLYVSIIKCKYSLI